MTIVVITEVKTEKDLAAFFPAPGNEWVLVRTAAEAEAHPGADVYVDLDFINEPGRVDVLRRSITGPRSRQCCSADAREIGYPFVRINGWPGFLERTIHELVASNELSADRFEELKTGLPGSMKSWVVNIVLFPIRRG